MEKNLQEILRSEVSPFDPLASDYDAWFEEEGRLIFVTEIQAFEEILSLLPKPWLEIGVGSGRFAQVLGIEVGLDSSIKLLELASQRGIEVCLGRGETAPFKDNAFGTVFLIVTLCFLDSPLQVLREANRLTREEGRLVLGLVLRESPWGRFYQVKREEGHRFYKYATLHSFTEVEVLLEQAGFITEKILSTLFQKPGEVKHLDSPRDVFTPDAGFTVIMAGKPSSPGE